MKRFTETRKWRDKWFRGLNSEEKLFWLFICDQADSAGFWHIDWDYMQFCIGVKIDRSILTKINEGKERVIDFGDYWYIKDFIKFQYGKLSEKSKSHQSVVETINKHKLHNRDITGLIEFKETQKQQQEENKEYKIKKDKLSLVIYALKIASGVKIDDRNWDKTEWSRAAKSAKDLLLYFQNDEKTAIKCIEDLVKYFETLGLAWRYETICRWKVDWWRQISSGKEFRGLGGDKRYEM